LTKVFFEVSLSDGTTDSGFTHSGLILSATFRFCAPHLAESLQNLFFTSIQNHIRLGTVFALRV